MASIVNQLSVFEIPSTIAGKLDRMVTRFFWSNTQGKGIPWRRKEVLHQPKGMGGLGIRNIATFNKALLMKQAWQINQHPSLLVSRVYARCSFAQIQRGTSPRNLSWGCRGLLRSSTSLLASCVWKVGNGCSIRASGDKWVGGRTPIMKDNVPLREAALMKVSVLIHFPTSRWDLCKLYRVFTPASARDISEIELPSIGAIEDTRIWPLTQSGQYTTKTGYVLALQHQQHDICSMTDTHLRFFYNPMASEHHCRNRNFLYGNYGTMAWPLLQICIGDLYTPLRIAVFVSTIMKILITYLGLAP